MISISQTPSRTTAIPSKAQPQRWESTEVGDSSAADDTHLSPRKLVLLSQDTFLTQRLSFMSRDSSRHHRSSGSGAPAVPMRPQHIDYHDVALTEPVTISTKHSVRSHIPVEDETTSSSRKRFGQRRLKIGGFGLNFKLPSLRRKRKSLTESQLRKRVRKSAEKGDWDAVRKLICNYEFSDIPEGVLATGKQAKRDSFVSQSNPITGEDAPHTAASRRPSYGSRKGEGRRSFTGKESAAAAAVIKMALLEEEISACSPVESDKVDIGENILHDVCRHCPPLDVLETLIAALRQRWGCTLGTDDQGNTPLHLAAKTGASPEAIDALIRADPSPASMGDKDRRSPLHLAMKFLAHSGYHTATLNHNGRSSKHVTQGKALFSRQEAMDRTSKVVLMLKDAMLAHPGKIDFKDEDSTGYSPLDYAIEGKFSKEEQLIHSLIRRKEPTRSSRRSSATRKGRMNRRLTLNSNVSKDDQDIDILRQLEQDEIEARRHRMDKIKSRRQTQLIDGALFDMFGIEEMPSGLLTAPAPVKQVEEVPSPSLKPTQALSCDDKESVEKLAEVEPEPQQQSPVMTEDDIYNQHLQDYLDDFGGDYDCKGLDEYCDEDGFDILEDPSVARMQNEAARMQSEASIVDISGIVPPMSITIVRDEDDSISMVSEIMTPR